MKGFKTAVMSAALGTAALCVLAGTVIAGPVTEAGETAGLALGTPLPEGGYFIDTASYISRSTHPETDILVNIPVLAYSTPWKILNGRVEAYAALPQLAVGTNNSWSRGMYNPFATVGLAWDLGNGFGFSNFLGGYAPMHTAVGVNAWTFNERAALSYTANGWNATVHGIYGTSTKDQSSKLQVQPDYLNIDLTATKAFGKWDLGAVGFGTWDTSSVAGVQKTSSIAAGPFVGYNFGPLSLQTYVTQDIAQKNRGGDDTRVFFRIVAPLGAL
jgi:hypothetical protein